MEIILSKQSQKFIQKLDTKHARQIVFKINDLSVIGHSNDTIKLRGSTITQYYRVDIGEFRIIYRHENMKLIIELVGKRNDDEVYNLFKRKPK